MPKLLKVRKRIASHLNKKPAKTQRSKSPSSSTPHNPRRVSASSKTSIKKSNAQLKAEIENLLGEDFETLADAQKALKRESSPVEKSPKKFFKIKKLSKKKVKNFAELVRDVDSRKEEIDALKEPDEYWGFRIQGKNEFHRSHEVFTDIGELVKRITEYRSYAQLGHGHGRLSQEFLDGIYIIKFDGTPANWHDKYDAEKAERESKYKSRQQRVAQREKKVKEREAKVAAREKRVKEREQASKSAGSNGRKSRKTKGK